LFIILAFCTFFIFQAALCKHFFVDPSSGINYQFLPLSDTLKQISLEQGVTLSNWRLLRLSIHCPNIRLSPVCGATVLHSSRGRRLSRSEARLPSGAPTFRAYEQPAVGENTLEDKRKIKRIKKPLAD